LSVDNILQEIVHINCKWATLSHKNFINSVVYTCVSYIILKLNLYSERKSSWQVLKINSLFLHVGEYTPISFGRGYIPLPIELKGRHGLVSIQNNNSDDCYYCNCIAFRKTC